MRRNLKKLVFCILLIGSIFACFNVKNKVYGENLNLNTTSKSECLMEVSSGRVLYSKNENLKLPIASTTKILTCITVIENTDINKIVKVDSKTTNIEGSSIYLKAGEELSVKDLLYGLMLRSGNDCAETLAVSFTSRENFIKLMNDTAKKIGANNSNFVNPHGLQNDNHYSTAKDMAIISCYALKNSKFREIVKTKRIEIPNGEYSYKRLLINKNKMLYNYKGATGIKTGYTKKAGRCLVSSAKIDNMEVVSVVLNSPNMWEDSSCLLDYAFKSYSLNQIVSKDEIENTVYTDSCGNKFLLKIDKSVVYPLKENERAKVIINGKNFNDFIKKPENNGKLEIYVENNLIFSSKIYTINCR